MASKFTSGMTSTKEIDHSTRAHALLAPSSAHRFINCPPSALLGEKYGERGSTKYTLEGTLAHEISELTLRRDILNIVSEEEFANAMNKFGANEYYSNDMLSEVKKYVDYCKESYLIAKQKSDTAQFFVEQGFKIDKYAPGSFGSADSIVLGDGTLEVIDLKYGLGVEVSAVHNEQLMMYALGAYEEFKDYFPETITMTICQVRKDNISSYTISIYELLEWAVNTLRPAAELAIKGEGEFKVGDWCTFCPVKSRCRALAKYNTELQDKSCDLDPSLLNDNEISEILARLSSIESWLKTVKEYAEYEAVVNKKHWPGFKLVAGRSNRKWSDDEKAKSAILSINTDLKEKDITETKLLGITKIEKMLSKIEFKKLEPFITKPVGNPTLVPESDKRPAINSIEEAIADFSE